MRTGDYKKLVTGIRITTIWSIFLVISLHLSIDRMGEDMIDLVLWGILILLVIQGFIIDLIIKRIKAER